MTGDLSPALLHALNLVAHVACAVLTGALAARAGGNPLLTVPLTSALFTLFPFATNVVLWVSAISYPLTTGLALGALLVYLRAREQQSTPWHLLALLLTTTAGLTYEAGVVTGAAIVGAELVLHHPPYRRWAFAHIIASAIPFAIIMSLSTAVPTEFLTGLHPFYNVVALLQSLAYPVAPLADLQTMISPITAMILLSVVTLAGLAVLNRGREQDHKQLRWFIFSLGWGILWAVMPLTTQPFNWFRDPTRAFYAGSAGAALMWGLSIAGITRHQGNAWWRRALQIAMAALALVPSFFFLREVTATHRMTGDLLWQAIETAQTEPETLVVNLPGRVTPKERTYPLMHEGIIPLPPPTNSQMLVRAHVGEVPTFTGRSMGSILPPLPYFLELTDPPLTPEDLRTGYPVKLAIYGAEDMNLQEAGQVLPPQPTGEGLATFRESVRLRSASCRWTGPTEITVEAEWQALDTMEGMSTVFTHWLAKADGALVTQADGDPLRGLYPLASWQPGEVIQEVRFIKGATTEGIVALGIWDPASGTRWEAVDAAGEPLPDQSYR
ncbi:MAG: hypothetical protein ACP5GX_11775, partial [Anaerolineae bacterium]